MSRKIQKTGGRRRASKIAALVDEGGRLDRKIREDQRRKREIRAELKKAGRLDLARKFLEAPTELKDLAGILWFNEPLVTFKRKDSDAKTNAVSPTDFPKRFELERTEGKPLTLHTIDFHEEIAMPMLKMALAKIESKIAERVRRGSETDATREMAIKCASLWPLEEWACVFPDAALAGDIEFIKKIIASHEQRNVYGVYSELKDHDTDLAACWHNSVLLSASGDEVPALKYWSDKAACEFVAWQCGDSISMDAYKARKNNLRLHSERPKLVTFANYTRRDKKHLLYCER